MPGLLDVLAGAARRAKSTQIKSQTHMPGIA
jgi:hypothetical protein